MTTTDRIHPNWWLIDLSSPVEELSEETFYPEVERVEVLGREHLLELLNGFAGSSGDVIMLESDQGHRIFAGISRDFSYLQVSGAKSRIARNVYPPVTHAVEPHDFRYEGMRSEVDQERLFPTSEAIGHIVFYVENWRFPDGLVVR